MAVELITEWPQVGEGHRVRWQDRDTHFGTVVGVREDGIDVRENGSDTIRTLGRDTRMWCLSKVG